MASPDGLVDAVKASAARLGVDPSDLLTAMSYETGGRLDPNLWGGKGGNYLGLIQFGPEERAKYGVKPGQSAAEQVGAAESFLRDRGLKPGMGLLDIYSTINAGRPGLYNRSDAANGGAAGTVADKVASMAGHRVRANALLGVEGGGQGAAVAPGSPGGGPAAVAVPSMPAAPSPLSISPGSGGAGAGDDGMAAILQGLAAIPAAVQQDQGMPMMQVPAIRYATPSGIAKARALARAMASHPIG